jgi:hypothetical protein
MNRQPVSTGYRAMRRATAQEQAEYAHLAHSLADVIKASRSGGTV